MKCPKCENLYPPVYNICPDCKLTLTKELFVQQIYTPEQTEYIEQISPYVENGDIEDFEKHKGGSY